MTAPGDIAVQFRDAAPSDAGAVARLHAASWRAHYRGSLSDAYLDGALDEDRRAVWAERLAAPSTQRLVLLARQGTELVGFVCAFLDHHERWGTLIDNLHVTQARKGSGIGRALMHEAAGRIAAKAPDRPVHLSVLDANTAARGFYGRIGGSEVARELRDLPGGSRAAVLWVAWPSPAALLAATTGGSARAGRGTAMEEPP